ncbi:MAG TPA: lysophospholipid acyltransferase family protein [Tenuifilaceae bacterium]|nr:lysophospholipid acyltransferase family protein [Tenuifilaceae bacterium]
MKRLAFYLFYTITKILALLPLRLLYVISDINRFLLYYVLRYRRKTVTTNLKNAFPDKSKEELKTIEWKFYRHLCDLFAEIIFLLHSGAKRAAKLCTFSNVELVNSYYQQGKSVVAAGGHFGNWELYGLFPLYIKHTVLGAYKPLNNKPIDEFIKKSRERFGCVTIPMYSISRVALKWSQEGKPFFLGLINDQSPSRSHIGYWTTFLNQETPVYIGTEKIARKINQPVVFCYIRKLKRGKYEANVELLVEEPRLTKPHEITEMHLRALERVINEAPEYWLWSHKRWKHKRDVTTNSLQAGNEHTP